MKQILTTIATVIATAVVSVGIFLIGQGTAIKDALPVAGVSVGNQYQSTSTPQVGDTANLCRNRFGTASSTTGILGAVNILNANTSAFTIYDATTTNISLRTGQLATTSLILAEFPASPTEGSYQFDIVFTRGLLVDYDAAATVSTSTISYRCEG